MAASQSGSDDDIVKFFVNGEAFSFTDENPDKDSSYAFTKISSETPKFDGRTDPVAATTFTNNVVDTQELTIDIRDHHVVPAGEHGNEQGTAPIILFKFTATNKTNEPLMPLLPSDFHALQSKQLADAPFPTKTPSAHLSTRSPWAKASKTPWRSSSRTPPRPSSSSSTISFAPGRSAELPIRSASPSFPMHPLPQPGTPLTACHHRCPTAKHIAGHSLTSPLVAKTPKQKEETPQSKRFLFV
ncbi:MULTISPECIES: hypothetical protein [unclassified Corynebacterium]|uniref:hypothetical protein n=1 Tax=unclassified Corynebacterium TaxID=2624378 RepID=UPI000797ACFD|nr:MULTISPECIES: hypothetical protein [unclassified Corynebacterium]KXB55727.1 hypothetical protein HMPREF0307_00762 [Corynebacterium sp. DNF00584]